MDKTNYYLIIKDERPLEFNDLNALYKHLVDNRVLAGNYIIIRGEIVG